MGRFVAALALAALLTAPPVRAQGGGPAVHRLGGVEPPDPRALAADPGAYRDLLAEQGLLLDIEGGTVSARGGTLHDRRSLGYPIEYLVVTDRGRTHEALFVVKAQPSVLDACFRALGLLHGHPMRWVMMDPQPPREAVEAGEASPWEAVAGDGPLVAVDVVWTDDDGRPRKQSLESMLLDVRDGSVLPERDWIYTGSGVAPLRQGRSIVQTFMADLQGNVIAIYLTGMGAALLERNSIEGIDDTLYTINSETAPARGTPVTLVFHATGDDAVPAPPPGGETIVAGEVGARMDEWLARAVPWGFAGVVLVARGDDILLHKGYGLADRERGVPMSTRTVFPLGDMSGYFVKTAIVQLADEGQLDLSDPIVRHLDGVPEEKAPVTIESLANRGSRLGIDLSGQQRFADLDSAVAAILAHPLDQGANAGPHRADLDLTLLAAIVESASGISWGDYLAEHVFGPAEMMDSGLLGEPRWAGSQYAYGDSGGDSGGERSEASAARRLSWPCKGGLVSSARDLFRWERAIARGLLDSDRDRAFVFQNERDPAPRLPAAVGGMLAWGTSIHGGENGLQVRDIWLPDEDATLIVVTAGSGQVAARVLQGIFRGDHVEPLPALAPPDAEAMAGIAGRYTGIAPKGTRFTVLAREDGVVLRPDDAASRFVLMGTYPRQTLEEFMAGDAEPDGLFFRPLSERDYACRKPPRGIIREARFWDREGTDVSGFTVFGKDGSEILRCRRVMNGKR